MADAKINVLFKRKPPTIEINRFLSRNKHQYFAQTNKAATHQDISRFYKEIGEAMAILEDKYSSQPPVKRQRIQKLVGTRDMINTLRKIHLKICRRLRSSPSLATLWRGDFTMDIPKEVFSIIFEEIIKMDTKARKLQPVLKLVSLRKRRQCSSLIISIPKRIL